MALKELVLSIYDRMESKLKDIEKKNLEKVDDPEKLKSAIAKALEEVKKGREEVIKLLEEGDGILEKIDEQIRKTVEEVKKYLGKEQTGVKTAKATFSRCVNSYKKRQWPKIEEAVKAGT
ncbi:MAG: hypothetical protein GXO07_03135 [Crenarchaeota archaeon]|nr:hypothetical protein [Thermoproteota archaeon]